MAMTTCAECKGAISDKADTCPHCGAKPVRSAVAAAKADLNRKLSSKEVIGGLVVVAVVLWWLSSSSEQAPAASTASPAAAQAPAQPQYVVKVTASELFKAYENNEVATDDKLRGNAVQITGKVQAIDKDFMDNAVVQLATANQFLPVRLTLKDSEKPKAGRLKKGDKVEIECPKIARIVGSPAGSDCFFP